jgi:hypothetical protein
MTINFTASAPSLSLQEELADVVARAVVEPSRDIESLPLALLGDFVRGRILGV